MMNLKYTVIFVSAAVIFGACAMPHKRQTARLDGAPLKSVGEVAQVDLRYAEYFKGQISRNWGYTITSINGQKPLSNIDTVQLEPGTYTFEYECFFVANPNRLYESLEGTGKVSFTLERNGRYHGLITPNSYAMQIRAATGGVPVRETQNPSSPAKCTMDRIFKQG